MMWRPETTPWKLALGGATLWPIVYIAIFILVVSSAPVTPVSEPANATGEWQPWVLALIGGHCLTMLMMVVLAGLYVVSAIRNPLFDRETRIFWALLLFFLGAAAMPVYWFRYIWPDTPRPPAN